MPDTLARGVTTTAGASDRAGVAELADHALAAVVGAEGQASRAGDRRAGDHGDHRGVERAAVGKGHDEPSDRAQGNHLRVHRHRAPRHQRHPSARRTVVAAARTGREEHVARIGPHRLRGFRRIRAATPFDHRSGDLVAPVDATLDQDRPDRAVRAAVVAGGQLTRTTLPSSKAQPTGSPTQWKNSSTGSSVQNSSGRGLYSQAHRRRSRRVASADQSRSQAACGEREAEGRVRLAARRERRLVIAVTKTSRTGPAQSSSPSASCSGGVDGERSAAAKFEATRRADRLRGRVRPNRALRQHRSRRVGRARNATRDAIVRSDGPGRAASRVRRGRPRRRRQRGVRRRSTIRGERAASTTRRAASISGEHPLDGSRTPRRRTTRPASPPVPPVPADVRRRRRSPMSPMRQTLPFHGPRPAPISMPCRSSRRFADTRLVDAVEPARCSASAAGVRVRPASRGRAPRSPRPARWCLTWRAEAGLEAPPRARCAAPRTARTPS